MGFLIIATEDFKADLAETYEYLSGVLFSPAAAQKLRDAVANARENIALNPQMMPVSSDSGLVGKDCRSYLVRNYVIVYQIRGSKVYLLRLFHQSQLKHVRK